MKIERGNQYSHRTIHLHKIWTVSKIGLQFVYIEDRYGHEDIVTHEYFRENFEEIK